MKGGPFEVINNFSYKSLTMPKKTERRLWDFSTSILSQSIKKIEGGPFGEKKTFFEKSLMVPKKTGSGHHLASFGILCYAKIRKTLFGSVRYAKWFNGSTPENFVELCRTILASSCGLEKSHYVSLHEAPTDKTRVKIFVWIRNSIS